jgi:hypothetical protein
MCYSISHLETNILLVTYTFSPPLLSTNISASF